MLFKQPAIPPEQEGELQERARRRIRGEAAWLAESDREVAARERRAREEEEAVARGAHLVLPDPEGDIPSTDVEARSPSGKKGQGGGGGGGAGKGEAAQGGGARGRGGGAGAAAGQPRPRADADGLALAVAAAAAVCAAAGAERTRDGRGLDGGGGGGAGALREVGGEDKGKAGEEGDPPVQRPGRQGREAQRRWAGDRQGVPEEGAERCRDAGKGRDTAEGGGGCGDGRRAREPQAEGTGPAAGERGDWAAEYGGAGGCGGSDRAAGREMYRGYGEQSWAEREADGMQ